VLCTAPFTSIVITSEQTVRPCCKYASDLGDLNKQTVAEILASTTVKNLQKDMYAHIWPKACEECKISEERYGNSLRLRMGTNRHDKQGCVNITYLEISSSNVCNLSCAGCSTRFSSGWLKYAKVIEKTTDTEFYRSIIQEAPIIKPDSKLLIKNLIELDLTHCKDIYFKGGEPLLNTDVLVVLRYLDKIDMLRKIVIRMDTSGAVIIDKTINETVALLYKAKQVVFGLSIDGPEEVTTYIRHSSKNMASLDNMRNFISIFEKNNINFMVSPTIMAYNIFSLDKLIEWWLYDIKPAFKHLTLDMYLVNFLIGPDYLSLQTLQPATINRLIDHYNNIIKTKAHGSVFSHFPDALKNVEYGGDKLHNQMVKYTLDMDKIKGQNVLDAVPELTDEMVLI
jgi:radical SAM protein with 4Fe4S-binding SPASM domain